MNTSAIAGSALTQDPQSRGFSVFEQGEFLLKKSFGRANTKAGNPFYNEPFAPATIYPNQVLTDGIPLTPPNDFVKLTHREIIQQFGVMEEEIAEFATYLNGVNQFSIQRSTSFPQLYAVNYCMLRPYMSNPELTFTATTFSTRVNILKNAIQFNYGDGGYRGTLYRTTESGELSRQGADIIKDTQLAFYFDTDVGYFVAYEKDTKRYAISPITSTTPPCVTCYIYKGRFGQYSPWTLAHDNTTIYYTAGQVLVGKTTSSNPLLSIDISGVGSIDNILTESLETYSDRRLKDNIVERFVGMDLLNLKVYDYNYKTRPGARECGVIAQEVEEVLPDIVKERDGIKTVQYDRFGILLLPIVRSLKDRLETLEAECARLTDALASRKEV